ncbi:MAG: sulfotransferase domain-containing protein [Verrucomicrobiota bacterium]
MQLHNPDAKILIVLRDPIDRAVSCYAHLVANAQLPCVPYEEGLNLLLQGSKSADWPVGYTVLTHGLYSTGIEIYRQFFDSDQILILDQRRFRSHPEEEMERVWRFLSLEPHPIEKHLKRSYQSVTYDLAALGFLNRASQLLSICNQEGVSLQRRRRLSPWRKRWSNSLRRKARSLPNLRDKPILSSSLNKRLQSYFAPEYDWLERELQLDFSHPHSISPQHPPES